MAKVLARMSIQEIPLKCISADPNQPRKYFDAAKMKTLQNSIKSYGIKQPLIVQEISKDKYLISVGERRFRAASYLKMDTVPCIIEQAKSEVDRLVEQFNVEEQHEQWTPVEKAVAISSLSEKMGLPLKDTCKLLNVADSDASRFAAFAEIVDKTMWVKNEVPLDMAQGVRSLKGAMKKITEVDLEEKFSRSDEKRLEHRIIELVKSGEIKKRNELSRLKDAFTKKPATIKEFLGSKVTPSELFHTSKAKGAYHLRNVHNHAAWVATHGQAFLGIKDVKISAEQLAVFHRAHTVLGKLAELAE